MSCRFDSSFVQAKRSHKTGDMTLNWTNHQIPVFDDLNTHRLWLSCGTGFSIRRQSRDSYCLCGVPFACWLYPLFLATYTSRCKWSQNIVHEVWSTWEIFRNNSLSRQSEFPATFKYTKKKLNSWQFPVDIPLEKIPWKNGAHHPPQGARFGNSKSRCLRIFRPRSSSAGEPRRVSRRGAKPGVDVQGMWITIYIYTIIYSSVYGM